MLRTLWCTATSLKSCPEQTIERLWTKHEKRVIIIHMSIFEYEKYDKKGQSDYGS